MRVVALARPTPWEVLGLGGIIEDHYRETRGHTGNPHK